MTFYRRRARNFRSTSTQDPNGSLMSHVEKLHSLLLFPHSASSLPLLKPHNNHKIRLPGCEVSLSRRRTARQPLLDQLTGPSVRCPAERVFLGGLCSLCQDRQTDRQQQKHSRTGTNKFLLWVRFGL